MSLLSLVELLEISLESLSKLIYHFNQSKKKIQHVQVNPLNH